MGKNWSCSWVWNSEGSISTLRSSLQISTNHCKMPTNHRWTHHSGPTVQGFGVYFDVSYLNKLFNEQSNCRWLETPWYPCYVTAISDPINFRHCRCASTQDGSVPGPSSGSSSRKTILEPWEEQQVCRHSLPIPRWASPALRQSPDLGRKT